MSFLMADMTPQGKSTHPMLPAMGAPRQHKGKAYRQTRPSVSTTTPSQQNVLRAQAFPEEVTTNYLNMLFLSHTPFSAEIPLDNKSTRSSCEACRNPDYTPVWFKSFEQSTT